MLLGHRGCTLQTDGNFQEQLNNLEAALANNPTGIINTFAGGNIFDEALKRADEAGIPTIASNNTCPVWTIPSTDYWSAMTIDSHCQILNDHRGLLSMLFIAVWTIAAVFVFLRA